MALCYNWRMSTANYLDRFLTPVTEVFTPELARSVLNIQVDAEMQTLVDSLASKANDGTISPSEEAEYKALIDAADLISVLRLKARGFLSKHSA